jgi:RNA polymerase sigma factor (sigma-70 family)
MLEDFQEVLVGCRAQDPKSLNKFIVGFYSTLFTTARKWLGDEDRAKDAVQSFFLHFLEKGLILQFRGDQIGQLRNFLVVCLRNHISSHYREFGLPNHETDVEFETLKSPTPSPEEEFDQQNIRHLIARIDFRYRRVLDLELGNYKFREIADILGLPLGTVSSYSARAKQILSRLLRENGFLIIPFFLAVLPHFSFAA